MGKRSLKGALARFHALHGKPAGVSDFVTHRRRPKVDPPSHPTWAPDTRADTAIVLQGPIHREDDFTVETVRHYRHCFPNAPIIVSTWEGEIGPVTEQLESLEAIVIAQKPPAHRGVSNCNLQMASSSRGVLEASRLGVSYVLKSRTDQRAYSPRLLGVLHATLKTFPLDGDRGGQSERVIGVSLNSFAYRMYGVSDMFTFGSVSDVSQYWNGNLDERIIPEPVEASSHRDFALRSVSEVRFCSQFLVNTGWPLEWTATDSWRALASRFAIIDASTIDLYWPKYTDREERWRTYDGNPQFMEIDFALWLMMFNEMILPEESILDVPW